MRLPLRFVRQEDILQYYIDRKCTRLEQSFNKALKDLRQSVVDCVKRRDIQLQAQFVSKTKSTRSEKMTSTPNVNLTEPSSTDISVNSCL